MKLKKFLKNIMITLPIMTITACTSNKISNRFQKKDISDIDNNTIGTFDKSINLSGKERIHVQTQYLKKNNVVYFDLNKYDVHPNFAEILDVHSSFLVKNPSFKIIIEGHTDERGTPEYNISLGERRANAVKIYLQGKGVHSEQISIVSYGKEKPAVLGHNETAYKKNRRAILIYEENYLK